MKRLIYILTLLIIISGCRNTKDTDERILKLGHDLVDYAKNSDTCCLNKPKDIVSIGKSTYWLLKSIEIDEELEYKLTTKDEFGESDVDYNLTIKGRHNITLRLIYDSKRDQYHIKGYFSDIPSKFNENWNIFLKQKGNLSKIVPGEGICGFKVGKTRRHEMFTDSLNEKFYQEMGITFHFEQNDTLKEILITDNLFLETESGIQVHDWDRKVKEHFGEPISDGSIINKGGYKIGSVSSLNYNGISFILSGNEIMMIIVREHAATKPKLH